jgi:hypothetical protein
MELYKDRSMGHIQLTRCLFFNARFRKERWFDDEESGEPENFAVFGDDDAAEGEKFSKVRPHHAWQFQKETKKIKRVKRSSC